MNKEIVHIQCEVIRRTPKAVLIQLAIGNAPDPAWLPLHLIKLVDEEEAVEMPWWLATEKFGLKPFDPKVDKIRFDPEWGPSL